MDVENQTFQGRDFSHTCLTNHKFTNCLFKNCNFTDCILFNTKFVSCIFTICNLSLLKIDGCMLQDVCFKECKIVGVDFFKCQRNFFSIKATESFLQYCNFSNFSLKGASFEKSTLKECHFIDTILTEVNFNESDLSGTIFHNSDLRKANFQEARNYSINPTTNKIKKAKFSFPEALTLLNFFDIEINQGF